jgi:pimeloyl-ACP methyl ester carboxylesterase
MLIPPCVNLALDGGNHVRRSLLALLASTLLLAALPEAAQAHPARPGHQRPIIFVHGFSGSGSQYETQARRFASNGYPADVIEAHEYDSTFTVNTVVDVYAGLDARVARLLARTGADKVDVLGHSLGTALMQGYLNSSPERAARLAHYVNLDGATAASQPGGVPTLAIWGEGNPARAIVGAINLYLSDQAHTETVTSVESFQAVYEFFTGRKPRTTQLLPEPPGLVRLSGRAVLFPTNVGVSDASLEVYEVNPLTGHRTTRRPVAAFTLTGDGSFGPFRARPTARYEFAIVRAGALTHHFYYQAFRRSDRLIRLLTSVPGTGLGSLVEASDTTTALVVNRNKEWWGDQDALFLNGVSVLNTANAPRTKRVIGIFAYDARLDAVTDLTAPIPAFFGQPFITGLDVYLPAAPNGAGKVSIVARPRGGNGHVDVINVPNWPSTTHRISLQFNDYT